MDLHEPVSVAVWRYDRTQGLYDGRISVPGRKITLIDAPLEEIFSRAFENAEFDVSELSFSNYLRLSVAGKRPYIGIPVFPSRSFRHGAFYVRTGAGIKSPRDLVGKRVGVETSFRLISPNHEGSDRFVAALGPAGGAHGSIVEGRIQQGCRVSRGHPKAHRSAAGHRDRGDHAKGDKRK